MEKIYQAVALEMGLKGWEERTSVVSEGYTKAVWKRKGDIGEWQFLIENTEKCRADEVFCLMELKAGKKFGAKLYTPKKVLDGVGINPILGTLRKGIERLVEKTTGGGYVCQSL